MMQHMDDLMPIIIETLQDQVSVIHFLCGVLVSRMHLCVAWFKCVLCECVYVCVCQVCEDNIGVWVCNITEASCYVECLSVCLFVSMVCVSCVRKGTHCLQSSPMKREVAVRTLGQLAESTGYVITPFKRYPKLLDSILSQIQTGNFLVESTLLTQCAFFCIVCVCVCCTDSVFCVLA